MTIDEFMRDIAPKMKKGFVFYDWMGEWQFCSERPIWDDEQGWWIMQEDGANFLSLIMFEIDRYDGYDDKNSLMEVGK